MVLIRMFSIIPAYYSLYRDVRRQKHFVKRVIEKEIDRARISNDGSLDEEDFSKIRNYYGFGVPAIVGEGICTLRGKAMSEKERITSTNQGALTGLYDDFFDKTHLDNKQIRKMMDHPAQIKPQSSLEKLFVHFLMRVHENLFDKGYFSQTFDQVFNAQSDTHKQLDENFSLEEIKEITLRKGGVSLLFYRSAFAHNLEDGEEEALYNAGGLMQLGNDIFDVYKDEKQKIRTLVTSCKTINDVRIIFEDQMDKTISLVKQSGFQEKDKRKFLNKLLLGISRCFVCLDQLEKLQQQSNGLFIPADYRREEMICDMEKPANIIRSIRYYLNYKL